MILVVLYCLLNYARQNESPYTHTLVLNERRESVSKWSKRKNQGPARAQRITNVNNFLGRNWMD